MFETKGYIAIERTNQDPDEIFMMAVDAGADDVQISDEWFEIYTSADELHAVSSALIHNGLAISEAQLSEIPKNEIELDPKETVQVMGVIEALEELDDVEQVYSGLKISDEALAALEAA
jgi:transcriptional/translational regulatory protein YebC/TACO1